MPLARSWRVPLTRGLGGSSPTAGLAGVGRAGAEGGNATSAGYVRLKGYPCIRYPLT